MCPDRETSSVIGANPFLQACFASADKLALGLDASVVSLPNVSVAKLAAHRSRTLVLAKFGAIALRSGAGLHGIWWVRVHITGVVGPEAPEAMSRSSHNTRS